jgi:hypothetical protein
MRKVCKVSANERPYPRSAFLRRSSTTHAMPQGIMHSNKCPARVPRIFRVCAVHRCSLSSARENCIWPAPRVNSAHDACEYQFPMEVKTKAEVSTQNEKIDCGQRSGMEGAGGSSANITKEIQRSSLSPQALNPERAFKFIQM